MVITGVEWGTKKGEQLLDHLAGCIATKIVCLQAQRFRSFTAVLARQVGSQSGARHLHEQGEPAPCPSVSAWQRPCCSLAAQRLLYSRVLPLLPSYIVLCLQRAVYRLAVQATAGTKRTGKAERQARPAGCSAVVVHADRPRSFSHRLRYSYVSYPCCSDMNPATEGVACKALLTKGSDKHLDTLTSSFIFAS